MVGGRLHNLWHLKGTHLIGVDIFTSLISVIRYRIGDITLLLQETPVPQGTFDTDVIKDTIRIDKDEFVHAPTKPGLCFEIDEANLKKRTIEIVS
jgi:L-alanine-DL-glutamate epimerase-like enolase superfamily enzyme